VGRIAGNLATAARHRSPLQAELDRLVRILLVVAISLIVIVTTLGFVRGQDLGDTLLAGISAAIAAIPEEPPILLAVILGLGAYRLLRRGVLVRRLNAEETLGAVDLIVTDKTGTLTRNRLEISSITTPDGPVADPAERLAILGAALRAEDDAWAHASGVAPGSFTRAIQGAIRDAGGSVVLDPDLLLEAEPVDDIRRYARTVQRTADGQVVRVLGAPEAVLDLTAVDAASRVAWVERIDAGAAAGERLVALAVGGSDDTLEMHGLVGFADPLRDGIREAFDLAAGAGIATIVVTGDHPHTAAAIARAAGLHDGAGGAVALGDELAAMDDTVLTERLPQLHVIARSTPDNKERLVRLARAAGRTVAVTGDGVNDAPALQRADVAVSMGSGTAVAKGASDLVLGDDSFATLLYGLFEGRRIVDNVQKGLVFLVSTHVALLGFILIATLAGFGQPLLPLQILWLELFIDLSTSIAFEREAAEPDLTRRPPRRRDVPLLDNELLLRIAVAGGYSAVAALIVMLAQPGSADHARWLAYTSLVCAQVVRAYANRSLRTPVYRLPPNGFLLLAVLVVLAIQFLIPYVPPLAEAFRATPLEPGDWLVVFVIALVPAIVAEAWRTVRGTRWVA
jgi:Ca2+-transporting ATPase